MKKILIICFSILFGIAYSPVWAQENDNHIRKEQREQRKQEREAQKKEREAKKQQEKEQKAAQKAEVQAQKQQAKEAKLQEQKAKAQEKERRKAEQAKQKQLQNEARKQDKNNSNTKQKKEREKDYNKQEPSTLLHNRIEQSNESSYYSYDNGIEKDEYSSPESNDQSASSSSSSDSGGGEIIVIFFFAIIFGIVCWYFSGRCAHCGKFRAMEVIGRNNIGRAKSKWEKDSKGESCKVYYNNIEVRRRCKYCGYEDCKLEVVKGEMS